MTERTKKTIHLIYSIVLSIMLAVAGICLIIACVGIYRSGSRPFTPQSVAAAFSGIAVPVYLCLVLLFGGFVLDAALPLRAKKASPEKQHTAILEKLHKKFSTNSCDPALAAAIRREQHKRKVHSIATGILLAAGSFIFLLYGANPANFHQSEITESMEKAMYVLLPCMALPFGYSVFAAFYNRSSIKKETALVKQALVNASDVSKTSPAVIAKPSLPWLRYGLLAATLVILLYGFFAGGTNDVLTKAINICTECVGLG